MRIWVLGGGSIGMLYAARLHAAISDGSGSGAMLITRTTEQARAIALSGITVSKQGHQEKVSCPAIAMNELVTALDQYEPPDWVLLTVKQYGITPDVVSLLSGLCRKSSETKVLAMQNGIGHFEVLAEGVPVSRLFGAVISEGAGRTSPTRVEHTGSGVTRIGSIHFSGSDDNRSVKVLNQLQKVLQHAGFRTVLSKQLNDDMWHKLIINSVINPLTALLDIRNGQLLQHQHLLDVMLKLYAEATEVARRSGVTVDDQLWNMLQDVCRNTARNRSSMLQDIYAGRPTELKWMNGAIVRMSGKYGVPVPTHELVMKLVQVKEDTRLATLSTTRADEQDIS